MTKQSNQDPDHPEDKLCPPEVSDAQYARIEKELTDISKDSAKTIAGIEKDYITPIIDAISNINDDGVKRAAIRDLWEDRASPLLRLLDQQPPPPSKKPRGSLRTLLQAFGI